MIRTASTAASNECCSFRPTANSRWRFSIGRACPFIFFGGADRFHTPRRSFLIIFRFFFLVSLWDYSDPRLLCIYGSVVVTLLSRLANTFASISPMKKSSLLDISLCFKWPPRTQTNLATCPLGNNNNKSRSCTCALHPCHAGLANRRPSAIVSLTLSVNS